MVKTAQKFRSRREDEYWISEKIFVREDMNHPELDDASLATCRLPVGGKTQLHSLNVDEIYMIKSGSGMMRKGEGPAFQVSPGDNIFIASGIAQNIENTGPVDLIFQTLCMPRFDETGYTALEK